MTTGHKIAYAVGGALMLSLAGLLVFGRNGYLDYLHLKEQKKQLSIKNQAAEDENSMLRRQARRLKDDPAYIEYIARKELGMIAGDEVIYTFKRQGDAP